MAEVEIKRLEKGYFAPGHCPNPSGRPKGIKNEQLLTLDRYIKSMGTKDFQKLYDNLIKNCLKDESWANKIYFDCFAKRQAKDQIINLCKLNQATNVNDFLANLLEMLTVPDSLTYDEVIALIKTMSGIKIAENAAVDNTAKELSDKQIIEIMQIMQRKEKKEE